MTESESGGTAAFSGLVAGIFASAMGLLQEIGSLIDGKPAEGAPAADDAASKAGSPEQRAESIRTGLANVGHYIDVLLMLQQKTKGNLTSEEERLLSSALNDLRITFVKLHDRSTATKGS
jgi:hypothetical protein